MGLGHTIFKTQNGQSTELTEYSAMRIHLTAKERRPPGNPVLNFPPAAVRSARATRKMT
jgi:hypothetical protein